MGAVTYSAFLLNSVYDLCAVEEPGKLCCCGEYCGYGNIEEKTADKNCKPQCEALEDLAAEECKKRVLEVSSTECKLCKPVWVKLENATDSRAGVICEIDCPDQGKRCPGDNGADGDQNNDGSAGKDVVPWEEEQAKEESKKAPSDLDIAFDGGSRRMSDRDIEAELSGEIERKRASDRTTSRVVSAHDL